MQEYINLIFNNKNLRFDEKALLIYLINHPNITHVSQSSVKKCLRISAPRLKKAMDGLQKVGLLKLEREKRFGGHMRWQVSTMEAQA